MLTIEIDINGEKVKFAKAKFTDETLDLLNSIEKDASVDTFKTIRYYLIKQCELAGNQNAEDIVSEIGMNFQKITEVFNSVIGNAN